MILRALLRALTLTGQWIYYLRLHRFVIYLGRRHPKVLLFHACEPVESDFIRGLDSNTEPDVLAEQLDFIRRYYNVVSIDRLESGELPPRSVAITFDDGYRSVLAHAVPLLIERELPATIYLTTGVVGNGRFIWVNELNWLLHRYPAVAVPLASTSLGLNETSKPSDILRAAHAAYDRERIHRLIECVWDRVPDDPDRVLRDHRPYLTWDEVRWMRSRGFAFGSHTVTHPSLPRLSVADARAELESSREDVRREVGECSSFAYPFGDVDRQSREIARATGFRLLMEVGGTNRPFRPERCARIPVRGSSAAQLFAEMELVPLAKGWLKSEVHEGAGTV